MRFGLLFSLLLAIVAVIFALQNPQSMDVNLLFVQTQGSTALVLIITFGVGVLVGLLSSVPARLRARRKLKELRSERNTGGPTSPPTGPASSEDPRSEGPSSAS